MTQAPRAVSTVRATGARRAPQPARCEESPDEVLAGPAQVTPGAGGLGAVSIPIERALRWRAARSPQAFSKRPAHRERLRRWRAARGEAHRSAFASPPPAFALRAVRPLHAAVCTGLAGSAACAAGMLTNTAASRAPPVRAQRTTSQRVLSQGRLAAVGDDDSFMAGVSPCHFDAACSGTGLGARQAGARCAGRRGSARRRRMDGLVPWNSRAGTAPFDIPKRTDDRAETKPVRLGER